jgi:hypothetical protein
VRVLALLVLVSALLLMLLVLQHQLQVLLQVLGLVLVPGRGRRPAQRVLLPHPSYPSFPYCCPGHRHHQTRAP